MCDHVPSVPVRFDVAIPEQPFEYVPVLWPKRSERVKVLGTSETITGCMTHWIEGRTRPCYAPVAPCPGCNAGYARSWKGFVGGVCFYQKIPVIVMLTAHACRPWVQLLKTGKVQLRGSVLTVWHENGQVQGKTRLDLTRAENVGALPPPLDVEGQLKHMWAVQAAAAGPDDRDRWEMIPVPGC